MATFTVQKMVDSTASEDFIIRTLIQVADLFVRQSQRNQKLLELLLEIRIVVIARATTQISLIMASPQIDFNCQTVVAATQKVYFQVIKTTTDSFHPPRLVHRILISFPLVMFN